MIHNDTVLLETMNHKKKHFYHDKNEPFDSSERILDLVLDF